MPGLHWVASPPYASRPCPLTDIAVEYDQGREHRFVIDRRVDSSAGWSNYPRAGRPNAAVIATDFRTDANDDLKIEMYFSRSQNTRHDLGHFRLSVTDAPDAFKTVAARYELRDGEVVVARQPGLFAAQKLVDPWAKLAAAYHLAEQPEALTRLLERRPAAAIGVGVGELYTAAGDWGRSLSTRRVSEGNRKTRRI